MPSPLLAFALLLASIPLLPGAGTASAAERFHKLWCLKYAVAAQAPLSMLLAGAPADQKLDLPFAMCAARSKSRVLVLDAGYLNQKLGEPFGARDWVEYGALLGEVGIQLDEVDFVTLSHLHFDHAGGTSKFPKAKFILQKRELEFAAAAMPHNSVARNGFTADDVLAAVQLNWQGRVLLVDGDQEDVIPGVDVYLTPGHTAGTMTVCLDTTRERFCYSSDAVYTYRNIDEDIPLGLALDSYQAVESYKKIRRILRGGTLIPGHEPRIFDEPEKLGFRRVSAHAIALVE